MRKLFLPLFLIAISLSAMAKKKAEKQTLSVEELAAITARGKILAEYDVAAWHATDVIQDLKPQNGSFRYYIARKTDAGWVVLFGRLSEARDKFLIVYQATQGTRPDFFTNRTFDPPLESTDFYFSAAKALDTAIKDLGPVKRPYNSYAIPAEPGRLYIYLLPAPTVDGVYPLGADVRYTFTSDGGTMLEKHPMHKTVLDFDYREKSTGGKKLAAGVHSHVLSNCPEDSDVFLVLTRRSSIPEYVGTMDKKIWVINTDGTISVGQ
ncbi:MAG TPA: hypothetical protein VMU05_05395 [Dongiaceae bacterium]|nr:hypothetical protein [Dongiaceae bacterium]